jgi:non-specific serine/threonine protein kinase/serine/threonine-protein kinase
VTIPSPPGAPEGAAEAPEGEPGTALPPDHPRQIGPYRILRVLGEGGIGLVYLAEQSEPVRRRVALKVIKVGMDTRQVVARFDSERQALAVMDHPNIAHVLDAGATEGRPYFVMEYVHGVAITDYCDNERLSTDERVRLFLEVCAAVQHAHQKGVVHRDLKPSNVMVGMESGEPRVKVIDFGIAKAMGQGLTDLTLVTRVGQILGTPAYMSPEQAQMSGVDVDTRSDIYSLGVVLYELLAGTLPIELGSVPDYALPHALRDADVPAPSARVSTIGDAGEAIARHRRTDLQHLRGELRGDLDWIVAKAMEKDRTRRYETVEALAADLRRHLQHLPVLARPRSAGYVFGRFMRRHKAGVAAGAVALIALIAGAALATAGFIRATHAEQEARQQAQTAERTAQFLVDLFEVSDPSEARGNTITAREILDRGAERIRTELADQPDVQSALMNTIGTVYRNLGLFDGAQEQLEAALATRRSVFGDESPQVLESLINLAEVHYSNGDRSTSERMLREALALGERLDLPGGLGMADAMNDLALVLASYERQEFAAAIDLYRRALDIQLRERGSAHAEVVTVQGNLAVALYRSKQIEEAEALVRSNLALSERVNGVDSPQTAIQASLLAEILSAGPDRAESERLLRRSLAIFEHTLGSQHQRVANGHNALGRVLLLDPDRYAEATAEFGAAAAIYETIYPAGESRRARALADVGFVLMLTGRGVEAESRLREALDMLEDDAGPPRDLLLVQARLADLLFGMGRHEEALAAARAALAQAASGEETRRAYAASALAAVLAALGRNDEAESAATAIRPRMAGRPNVLDQLSMRRAFALYATWAGPGPLATYRADLESLGFEGLDADAIRSGS